MSNPVKLPGGHGVTPIVERGGHGSRVYLASPSTTGLRSHGKRLPVYDVRGPDSFSRVDIYAIQT